MDKTQDVDGGWAWLVLASSFLIHMMSYGMAWSTGVYNVIFLDAFNQPKAVTAWAGALPTAVMYAIGPVSSMLTNKYGFRPVIIAGGLITSVGLSLSYLAPNLYYLYFTFGVMSGAGFGIAYIPSIVAISCYFDKRISLAAGIAASGTGVGNFLYPALIRWLINTYDWKSSLLIIGAINLHICVFGTVMRPVKRPEIEKDRPILDITPFKKKGYLMLCINNFLFCCGISALYIHLSALAERKGISPDHSALLVSGLGISNLLGRFGFGILASYPRFNVIGMYGLSFFLSGVCICVVPVFDSFVGLLCCAVMFGLLSGCFGTLLVTILIQLLGLQRFANGYGCLLLFEAAGQLIGGSLTGAMFDLTQSYTLAFVIGGAMCIVSSVVMIQPYLYVKDHPLSNEVEIPAEKAMLSDSTDIPTLKYPSHRHIVQMTASVESLAASRRILNLQRSTHSLFIPTSNGNNETNQSVNSLVLNKKTISFNKSDSFY